MVDPSSGGHIDGEQQEVELKAADEEGGHDVADEQAQQSREQTEACGTPP